MARIGTLSGTLIRPGVSKNHRRYTPEALGRAAGRMQAKLKAGQPIPMHTSHMANADGDVTATAASITKVEQRSDGSLGFEADLLDTPAGHAVKALAVPDSSGRSALKGVSIFGKWVGPVGNDEDGNSMADDLDIEGVDFTHRPGVPGAGIEDARERRWPRPVASASRPMTTPSSSRRRRTSRPARWRCSRPSCATSSRTASARPALPKPVR